MKLLGTGNEDGFMVAAKKLDGLVIDAWNKLENKEDGELIAVVKPNLTLNMFCINVSITVMMTSEGYVSERCWKPDCAQTPIREFQQIKCCLQYTHSK
jgi:hypothetical protein